MDIQSKEQQSKNKDTGFGYRKRGFKTVIKWLFTLIKSERLEQKAWFRFIRVMHVLLIIAVLLIGVGTASYLSGNKEIVKATLVCKDGTTWNALNNDLSFSSADQCGVCTKRNADNTYTKCSFSDSFYRDNYVVNREYDRTSSWYGIGSYSILVIIIGLIIVRILLFAIVYIFIGKKK